MTQTTDPGPPHDHHGSTSLEVLVAGLAGAVSQLGQVGRELLAQSVLSRVQRVVVVVLLVLLTVTTVASTVGTGFLLYNSGKAKADRAQQKTTSTTILDCTKPGGTCYERNQTQLAALIAQLNRTTLITVECADALDGNAAISACVTRRLKENP